MHSVPKTKLKTFPLLDNFTDKMDNTEHHMLEEDST
jgi:hypothetical protein